jgi:hypothetical protein
MQMCVHYCILIHKLNDDYFSLARTRKYAQDAIPLGRTVHPCRQLGLNTPPFQLGGHLCQVPGP